MSTRRRQILKDDPVAVVNAAANARRTARWRMSRLVCVVLLDTVVLQAGAHAQGCESGVWTYEPEGRRDPFVNPLGGGRDGGLTPPRPEGLAGLSLDDVTLRGLVSVDDEYLAVFEAPDKRSYILRGGERLFDGTVKSVTRDGVVFLVAGDDPLSMVSARELRRTLGGGEGGP